jgi:glycosyltransferase involved in cell wall biosynthesis
MGGPIIEIKISVILPVYNAERHLEQCLDSIIGQTLKDIEIICIDDGSQDRSPEILQKYALIDRRIRIITQENSGAGAARNKGLSVAKGTYLSFLDADDFFEAGMLEAAYLKCLNSDADFLVFRSDYFNDASGRFEPCMWPVIDRLLPGKNVFNYKDIKRDIFRVFNGWAWDKLYKKEFVESNGLFFQEQRSTNDLYFVFAALVCAKRITVSQRILAHHRVSNWGSLSVTRDKSWECFFDALLALREKLNAIGIYEEVRESYINYALHFSLWNLNTIQGVAYEKLYNKLRDEWFNELGITTFDRGAFYLREEIEQYERIMDTPLVVYLLNEIECYKKKAGFGNGLTKSFDQCSYKVGRAITLIPRIFANFYMGWRKRGFKYTIRYGLQVIHNKLRRK